MNIYTDNYGTTDIYQVYKQLYESRRGGRPAVFCGAGGSPYKRVKGFRPGDHSAVVRRQQLGERRMDEMRRDDFSKTGGSDLPPFAEDLVFWAPLTEGDLTDHISGETGVTVGGASLQWDSSKGMYLMTVSTTDQYGRGHDCCALKFNGSQMRNNLTGCYKNCTLFAVVIEQSYVSGGGAGILEYNTRYVSMSAMKEVWETSPRSNVFFDGVRLHRGSVIDPAATIRACATMDDNVYFKVYNNGVFMEGASWDSLANPVSLGIMDKNGHGTSTRSPYNTISASAYIKDVRVYKRCLSASEVAQL